MLPTAPFHLTRFEALEVEVVSGGHCAERGLMETEKLTTDGLDNSYPHHPHGHHPRHSSNPSPNSNRSKRKSEPLAVRRGMADVKTLLTYTKCFLIAAYFVFICGSGITLNELFEFLIEDYQDSRWITGVLLLVLGAISFLGLWGAFKEDSCVLMVYGVVILVVFFLHVVLLFLLKNACTDIQKKCYSNMATPPGLAPILVAISELAIAMCAFFMALVIESEKKRQQPVSSRGDSV